MVRAAAHSEVVTIVGLGLSLSGGLCLASLSIGREGSEMRKSLLTFVVIGALGS